MLAGGADDTYRRLLRVGAQFVCRVEVHHGGVRVDPYGDGGLPISSGSIQARLGNRVARRLQLELPGTLFPWVAGDLLDPLVAELVVWAGWRAGAAPTYWWPVFTGPVTSVGPYVDGAPTVPLSASDRAETIVEDRFLAPVQSGADALVTTRIRDLITDSVPGVAFGQVDETYVAVPQLTWESDRAQALDDLAAGAGSLWYQLPDGRFTVRVVPWAGPDPVPPVATIDGSDSAVSVSVTTGRDGVYTAVQVTGEAPTGDAPVSGWAQDEDPASRTYVRGPLGRRVLQLQEDTIYQSSQAQSLARQWLRRTSAQVMAVATVSPFDPALELGDSVRIVARGGQVFDRILASFSAQLVGAATMSASWRAIGESDE